jgi:cyanate permease
MAVALEWVSRIMTVALEMVLPGILGLWIDRRLGIPLVFTLLGFGLGGSLSMWHLLRMTRLPSAEKKSRPPSDKR